MILVEALKDLFFPSSCAHCGAAYGENGSTALCNNCVTQLELFTPPQCARCSSPISPRENLLSKAHADPARAPLCRLCRTRSPSYDRLVVLGSYHGVLESLVKAAKFADDGEASERLCRLAKNRAPSGPYDSVIAVPSDHPLSNRLADTMSEARGAQRLNFLLRMRNAVRQGNLTRAERKRNAPRIYTRREIDPGQSVLLVDDVVTTSATIEACAMLIRNAGALRIDALAIAKTPRRFK